MFIDVRQRPNTVGLLVGADARTSVPTVRMCEDLMLVDCSLLARPALGAATTVDIRCLSSLAKVSFLACKTGGFGLPKERCCNAEGAFL